MNLKDTTVDLDLAKLLKSKGFPQKTWFYHEKFGDGWEIIDICIRGDNAISAPTVEELLAELPSEVISGCSLYTPFLIEKWKGDNYFLVGHAGMERFKDKKLCNALAKCWLP